MKKITFNTLKLEGFGRYEKLKVFKLNNLGLNVIRGLNGSGKTTLVSALVWVLYDEPVKPGSTIQTWEHLRTEAWQGTMVSVSYEVNGHNYRIKRMKDYLPVVDGVKGGNRLIFEVDGEKTKLRLKGEIQSAIESSLGMSHRAFTNSLFFQQKGVRFIEQDGPEKKKILEEFFKLTWITAAAKMADSDRTSARLSKVSVEKELRILTNQQDSLNSILTEMDKLKREHEKKQESEMNSLLLQIDAIKLAIPNLAKLKQDYEDAQKFLDKCKEESEELLGKYGYGGEPIWKVTKTVQTRLDEITSLRDRFNQKTQAWDKEMQRGVKSYTLDTKAKTCPWCNSSLENPKTRKELLKKMTESIAEIQRREPKLTEREKESILTIPALQQLKDDLHKAVRKTALAMESRDKALEIYEPLSQSQTKLEGLNNELERLKSNEFQDNSESVKKSLEELEEQVEDKMIDIRTLDSKIALYDWAIKKPLSNTGIKSFLFDKLLSRLNDRLKYYSAYTGFLVELIVDMQSGWRNIEAIITQDGAPVSFKDLSGGETQLVNVSIALASGDILLSEIQVNIRIFDEVTESLDEPNTELMATFLRKLADTHSVFVITHNKYFQVDGINEIRINKN